MVVCGDVTLVVVGDGERGCVGGAGDKRCVEDGREFVGDSSLSLEIDSGGTGETEGEIGRVGAATLENSMDTHLLLVYGL
jgi:hypothetical protein